MEKLIHKGKAVAVITGMEKGLADVQSALDLMMRAKYEASADLLAVDKAVVGENFFVLSPGLAGEVLQKFTNYRVKIAIFGICQLYQ